MTPPGGGSAPPRHFPKELYFRNAAAAPLLAMQWRHAMADAQRAIEIASLSPSRLALLRWVFTLARSLSAWQGSTTVPSAVTRCDSDSAGTWHPGRNLNGAGCPNERIALVLGLGLLAYESYLCTSRSRAADLFSSRTRIVLDRVCMSVYIAAMKRTNMHLKDDQIKRLKALSAKTGAPLSELVRRAIEEYLKKHKD